MGNIVIKLGVFGLFCLATAGMAAKQQKIPEWKDETNVPEPSRYESFEDGIPEHWELQGQGSLSINPWHYKLGKQSLQWDFKAGDVIRINNTLGNTQWRGGMNNVCYASFGVWVYNKEPMPGKSLRFEFREGDNPDAYLDFSLNFKGWQCAFARYDQTKTEQGTPSFSRPVTGKIDNILVKAPEDVDGRVMIDCLVYNGPTYYFINMLPNPEPWQPPALDEAENPLPGKVSEQDLKAIERVKEGLSLPVIVETEAETNPARYEEALEAIKYLEITEDEHGIRGRPINMPRWHASGASRGISPFFLDNNIPDEQLEWFNRAIIYGGAFTLIQRAMTSGVTRKQYDYLCEQGALVWKYLLDQGFNTSAGNGHYNAHTFRDCIRATSTIRDGLSRHDLLDEIMNYLQYSVYPFFAREAPTISMDYFGAGKTLVYSAFLSSDNAEKQLQILRFLGNRFSREITGDFGSSGFKPDGTGYHGIGFAFNYFQNGLWGISRIAYLFADSSFALSDEAFETLKRAALRMYFYSNNIEIPLFFQGVGVFNQVGFSSRRAYQLPGILRNLALAGADECDRELAQAYVNLKPLIREDWYDPIFEEEHGIKPSAPPEGNISMPYAPLVAQRRSDWVAVAWGGGVDMRASGNHYGYFLQNGPLAIMGKNGLNASGTVKEGWDWNRIDGVTAPYIPELIDMKYVHNYDSIPQEMAQGYEKAGEWLEKFQTTDVRLDPVRSMGNGGISWRGQNGSFRKIFGSTRLFVRWRPANFHAYRGIKSYFFINNRIYALGSDIKSYSAEYSMQTTLYQKALEDTDSPTFINGEKITEFPSTNNLPLTINHYLIDAVGNGYFIPAGQNIYTARKTQEGRVSRFNEHEDTIGDYATAWLDHGTECEDAKYVYVIMPYCDHEKFMAFGEDDYEILQQDGNAHILHDKIDGFYAGIFFEGGMVKNLPYVKNIERACQIMYKENEKGALEIAVGDPATHRWLDENMRRGFYGGKSVLTPLTVTFAGAWELEGPIDGVKIIESNEKETVIEFAFIHGKTFDFLLTEKKIPWLRRLFGKSGF